ncbi:MAG: hypothetical protein ACEQSR_03750 [Candidatus Methylacidiphilales bacterium]
MSCKRVRLLDINTGQIFAPNEVSTQKELLVIEGSYFGSVIDFNKTNVLFPNYNEDCNQNSCICFNGCGLKLNGINVGF